MKTACLLLALLASPALAEIPKPDDAPQPLTPAESAKTFHLPAGAKIRLLASEPLIREPSGVCWDDKGRCFVSELHGYNLEGQYDLDELNKTGRLDMEVRRIHASEASKKKAEAGTYGTVKLLRDTDGDGVMDKALVWADRLPPCYGLVAANGGILVACAPHIVFLKDADGDDMPEVNEKLFTGFGTGMLERGVNAPTHGPDGWIYFGKGWASINAITGPRLKEPLHLPDTDFRIRADGSAIEPVSGSTKTMGMAFTDGGERFVCTTMHPGLFVTPLPWRYLKRNPDAAAPVLDSAASDDTRVYPISKPHPWRTKREQHAEYFAFYRKISLSDAAASGYFTSACGPLVHDGYYLVCEPSQNLIHRAKILRDGTRLRLERFPGEEKREFLASTDSWFHPVSLTHTPEGHIAICDFYREIIEDYSAIPRHLQQQYGVINGNDRGRIWILETGGNARHEPTAAEAKILRLRENDDSSGIDPAADLEPHLALQLALSVGADKNALLALARKHGHLRWMDAAIASSAHKLEKDLLIALSADPGKSGPVMINLAGIIAARGDAAEIAECLATVKTGKARELLQLGLEETKPLASAAEIPVPTAPTAAQNAAWEKRVPAILAALKQKPDITEGKILFTAVCAACHQSHGIGLSVGPGLDAEFQRAPETILRDILFPSEAARPGYDTIMAKTQRGETLLGITASDSPTSITLRLPGGMERTLLKKRATLRTVRNVSLMPPGLGDALTPQQIANVISFLRS
jgi:putative membrane-bound dehydrogenase-like protein